MLLSRTSLKCPSTIYRFRYLLTAGTDIVYSACHSLNRSVNPSSAITKKLWCSTIMFQALKKSQKGFQGKNTSRFLLFDCNELENYSMECTKPIYFVRNVKFLAEKYPTRANCNFYELSDQLDTFDDKRGPACSPTESSAEFTEKHFFGKKEVNIVAKQ